MCKKTKQNDPSRCTEWTIYSALGSSHTIFNSMKVEKRYLFDHWLDYWLQEKWVDGCSCTDSFEVWVSLLFSNIKAGIQLQSLVIPQLWYAEKISSELTMPFRRWPDLQFEIHMLFLAISISTPMPWLCHRLLVGLWFMGCWIIQFLGFGMNL